MTGTTRTVVGQVAKGPLDAATVAIYALDARGGTVGTPLVEAVTDTRGEWRATLPPDAHGPLLATTSGGRYIDEADPEPDPALRRSVTLAPGEGFAAVIPAGENSAAINIFTEALLRKTRLESSGADFEAVFERNRLQFANAFGFDPVATLPADPIAPSPVASNEARRYAMALGGMANVVNDYAIANGRTIADYAIIDAVTRDYIDCTIDGRAFDAPLSGVETVRLDLNAQILRFRNNNSAAYAGVEPIVIATAECGRSGGVPDTVAPVFTFVPTDFTVAAVDASGVASSHPDVTAALVTAVAVDDRDGDLVPIATMPAMLPLGRTAVTLRVVDAAGNVAETTIVVTVADLAPPTIEAPPDIELVATGPLTAVELGAPAVGDNVTATSELAIGNDAPAGGFAAGTTTVTWRVTDAAGLSATATQRVTVHGAPPTLLATLPDLEATEGEPFAAAFAASFADPDSALRFELTGLPAGTGLALDAASGILSGVPTDADAQASPLRLTLTASDEAAAASGSFTLYVGDVNNAPVFTVVGDVALEEDFAAAVAVEVTPAPVPAGDPNDVVYSLSDVSADFVNLEIDPRSGRVTLTSQADANGVGSFTITADDGAAVNNLYSVTVPVRVAAVDDPPRFTLSASVVELTPGFTGRALVNAVPAPVPADELGRVVRYRIEHRIPFADIAIDELTGQLAIGDAALLEANGLIEVVADDGVSTHRESLTLIVRDDATLRVFVGEPVTGLRVPEPVFARDELAVDFSATGLPASLKVAAATGELEGTPTEADGRVGALPVEFRVRGSLGSVVLVTQVLHVIERDTDRDGLPDRLEALAGTDPARADTDGDGLGDGIEVEAALDPLVAVSSLTWFDAGASTSLDLVSGASAADPAVYVFGAGRHESTLTAAAPCRHIVLLGGVDATVPYPSTASRAALTPAADEAPVLHLDECVDVRLHHLSFTAGDDAPVLSLKSASVAAADLAFYRNGGGAIVMSGGDLHLADSVFSGNATEVPLIDVRGASDVVFDRAVIRHDAFRDVFAVAAASSVELVSLRGPGGYRGEGRVIKTGRDEFVMHTPDEMRLARRSTGNYVASLYYLGLRLGHGYIVDYAGDDIESVDDINSGDYLVRADHPIGAGVMFFVHGYEVPFVIE